MERFLSDSRWRQGSPFGGHYIWLSPCPEKWLPRRAGNAGEPLGAIAVTAFAPDAPLTLEPRLFQALQEQFEVSSRPRGKFTSGFNGWPLFVVYSRP